MRDKVRDELNAMGVKTAAKLPLEKRQVVCEAIKSSTGIDYMEHFNA
jgi:hypothetical protein